MASTKNREIADLLDRMGDALEIKGELIFKVNAYRKAARVLRELPEDVSTLHAQGRLRELPGVGEGMAKKIAGYLETGVMPEYEEVLGNIPEGLFDLLKIPDVGPRTAKLVWEKLGITDLEGFKRVIQDGTLASLPGMGEKKVEKIKRGIAFKEKASKRIPLGIALPIAEEVVEYLTRNAPVQRIEVAGSLRRMKETIGDIDILVVTQEAPDVMTVFVHMPGVSRIIAQGDTKTSVVFRDMVQMDVRAVPAESYGAALAYFTGSKAHNVRMREIAKKHDLKLSEYGLFRENVRVAGDSEEGIFRALRLPWIPPEIREDAGEIEAAQEGRLPSLIEPREIRGDLHCHTNYSDGSMSIEDVLKEAMSLGYEYIAITDHSQGVRYAHGVEVDRLHKQWAEIEALSTKYPIKVLKGSEVDILADGSLDYPEEVLKRIDFVMVAVHQGFTKDNTERILKAIRNPYVTALAHPTGRLIGSREPYPVDLRRILEECARLGVIVEINAHYQRLDLNDQMARLAKDLGVKMMLGTDHHHPGGMRMMRFGVGTARRGWLEPGNIVNTLPYPSLLKVLRSCA
ncbi:MAG: DNA polymerase/3'-5' exonuclease PolX [bacterium JZ-2024 1]